MNKKRFGLPLNLSIAYEFHENLTQPVIDTNMPNNDNNLQSLHCNYTIDPQFCSEHSIPPI